MCEQETHSRIARSQGPVMASKILENIQEEMTCPICLGLLQEPLSLECGHSFCQACITANKKESEAEQEEQSNCPVCRISYEPGRLRPNRHLANIAEQLREVKLNPEEEQMKHLCVRHGEKLLLFCKQDGKIICWLCERSQEHRGHQTFLIEEIAQEYEKKLRETLEKMRKKLQKARKLEADVKERTTSWESQIQKEKQSIQAEFAKLKDFLDYAEQKELQKLNNEEVAVLHKLAMDENELIEQSQLIEILISDLEHRLEGSVMEKLQDANDIIERCCKLTLKQPKTFPKERRCVFQATELKGMLQGLTDLANLRYYWVDVILNYTISNSTVEISKNKREVRSLYNCYPNRNHVNYNYEDYAVIGSSFFTKGKHYWEVDVSEKSAWILGVCGENYYTAYVPKFSTKMGKLFPQSNFYCQLQPRYLMWVIEYQNQSGYKAFENTNCDEPRIVSLSVTVPPDRIGVFLDYDADIVSFYNITNHASRIYEYSECFFPKRVLPYLNPLHCQFPMIICKPSS